ncbi:hypothetical protein OpiT1DRAFT_04471 [Opitutaceae bacterium TAV1]|nr:hypothetical protein OpiT1DRAFT_04471 [Opitutaceae bacterium TAV1]
MKLRTKTSTLYCQPAWFALAIVAIMLCAGLGYFFYTGKKADKKESARLESSLKRLSQEIGSLSSGFSDEKVVDMQNEAASIRKAMMSPVEVDRFVASLRPFWTVAAEDEQENPEYIHRRYRITRGTAPIGTWSEIRALCRRFAGIPSMSVNNIEIQTVGDSRKREFSRITMGLSVYVRKTS